MGKVNIIKASAGSGKTYKLAYEYVRNVVSDPYSYRHILAVTFTNKATAEMKARILSELNKLAGNSEEGYMSDLVKELKLPAQEIAVRAARAQKLILHDYSRFSVLTIDKFFVKILRAFEKELNIETDSSINLDQDYFINMAIDRLIMRIGDDSVLAGWLEEFLEEKISGGKSHDIRASIYDIARKVLDEEYNSDNCLRERDRLIDFFAGLQDRYNEITGIMVSAAREFITVSEGAGYTVEAYKYGRSGFYGYVGKIAAGDIQEPGKRVRDALAGDSSWGSKGSAVDGIRGGLERFLRIIVELWDEYSVFIRTFAVCRKSIHAFVLLSDINRNVRELCVENNTLLLSLTGEIIGGLVKDNDAPFIYEKTGSRYDRFMIDEFQDTSRGQWSNFVPLLSNAVSEVSGDGTAVSLVGDVKQSIYRWRGGDWRILENGVTPVFHDGYVDEEVLDTNWRSDRKIVEFNNAVISAASSLLNGRMNAVLDEALNGGAVTKEFAGRYMDSLSRAYRDIVQKVPANRDDSGYVEVRECSFREEENLKIMVEAIEDLQRRGFRPRDIAVLVRKNKEAEMVTDYIMRYKSGGNAKEGVSYDIVSDKGLRLTASPVVRFVTAVFSLLMKHDVYRLAVHNEYLGRPLSCDPKPEEKALWERISSRPVTEIFENILEYYSLGEESENIAYLQALHDVIITFSGDNTPSLAGFTEWWEVNGDKQYVLLPEEQQAIKVETIHKSKGLQYGAVIMPFCNWELAPMPNSVFWGAAHEGSVFSVLKTILLKYSEGVMQTDYAESGMENAILEQVENFNSLYVAMTRPEKELYIALNRPERGGDKRMSALLREAVMQAANTGTLKNSFFSCDDDLLSFRYGDKSVIRNVGDGGEVPTYYGTADYHDRIKLRLSGDRYYEESGEETAFDPRGYGVLMHRIFEQLEAMDEIPHKLEKMLFDGELTVEEHAVLTELVGKAAENRLIASWFDSRWEVRNENSILVPAEGAVKSFAVFKPDRVIMDGDSAVVIDYKFGLSDSSKYAAQVRNYAGLLRRMGYTDVKGYLWYVMTGRVEQVV